MKFIIATVMAAALALAEPPPSKSYLPPPPAKNGFSAQGQGFAPEVIAARSLGGHGSHAGPRKLGGFGVRNTHDYEDHRNGFGRSAPRGHGSGPQARLEADDHGYDSAKSFGRNAFDEGNSEPANYNFGYMVNDQEGTEFGHHEERQEERAQGEYHVVLPDGKKQTVNYEADERGFKPQISYQDADRSGYDSNAQDNFRANNGARGGHFARSGGY